MIALTRRQQQVLDFVKYSLQDTGMPPTRSDIAKALGFRSANAAEEHLKALAKKGAIEIIPGTSRGIRVIDEETPEGLPIIGQVAAGSPITAVEHIEDYCPIALNFFKPHADFLLRVRGESMRDVGILDGDLLAVHHTKQANDGDIIVARIEDEVTVKRLQHGKKKHEIILLAENKEFQPIHVDLRDTAFAIEGISVGVIRR